MWRKGARLTLRRCRALNAFPVGGPEGGWSWGPWLGGALRVIVDDISAKQQSKAEQQSRAAKQSSKSAKHQSTKAPSKVTTRINLVNFDSRTS